MEKADVQQLRELLVLARKLRLSAAGTTDQDYVDLFLRAASALEDRAHRLAYGTSGTSGKPAGAGAGVISRIPVDLTC